MEDPETLLKRVVDWAHTDARVSAVVQTGSHARGDGVDEYSDLDIELIGPGWEELAADDTWYHAFGDVMVRLALDNDGPDSPDWPTRLVVYGGGRKIDFTMAGEQRITDMRTNGLNDLYERGYIVLFDRRGLSERLPTAAGSAPTPALPTAREFERVLEEFWFEASQVAIYLARGDLWVVKFRDFTMKSMLLRVLEWWGVSDPAGARDVWHIGHNMGQWLPAELWARVHRTFGHFAAPDGWRALDETTQLFREVSATVAERLGYPVNTKLADDVTGHIHRIRQAP